jgi:hypothetical protein
MPAIISRKLVIKKPQQFYKLLKDKSHIVQTNKQLTKFRDTMYIHITGCNCNDARYLKQATKVYRNFNFDDETIKSLKESVGCDNIIFQIAGVKIYQI